MNRSIRTTLIAVIAAGALVLSGCADEVEGSAATQSGDAPSTAQDSAASTGEPTGAEESTESGTTAETTDSSAPETTEVTDPATGETTTDGSASGSTDGSAAPDESAAPDADVAAFAKAMQDAVAKLTSMSADMTMAAGGMNATATVKQELDNGTVTALDMSMDMGAFKLNIIQVDGTAYAGPGAALTQMGVDTGGKEWIELSADSTNPILSQLASQIGQTASQTGPQQYAMMTTAASALKTVGTEKVDGVEATHYLLTVDVAKLAEAGATESSTAQAAQQAGLSEIPLDIWLDKDDRPVKVAEKFSIQGQDIDVTVTMGQFNESMDITAPAPGDVAQG